MTDPAASGQPPLQLEGYQRVSCAPGASQTVTFPLTQRNLQYWNSTSNSWATSTGSYGISVGDSDANLPLSGTLRGSVGAARPAGHHHQPRPAGRAGRRGRRPCR